MAKELLKGFKELGVPHTDEPNLVSTLGDPVNIRSWQVGGNLFVVLQGKKPITTDYCKMRLSLLSNSVFDFV